LNQTRYKVDEDSKYSDSGLVSNQTLAKYFRLEVGP